MATAAGADGRRAVAAVLIGTGVALGLAVAATALIFALVSIPIYFVADDPAGGLDRDLVRFGLFGIAAPLGAILGAVGGVLLARWYLRGARLPEIAGR